MSYRPVAAKDVNVDESKLTELQKQARIIAATNEHGQKRQKALQALQRLVASSDHASAVRQYADKLVATLQQVVNDRNQGLKQQVIQLIGTILVTAINQTKDTNKHVSWIFQNIHKSQQVPGEQSAFLHILAHMLDRGDTSSLRPFIATVIINIKSFLEEITDTGSLPPVITAISTLGRNWPDIFATHFQDVVDYLVGWRLDPSISTSDSVADSIIAGILALKSFWVASPRFGTDLLSQFLTDMYRLVDRQSQPSLQGPKPTKVPPKVYALLDVFVAIFRALESVIMTDANRTEGDSLIVRYLTVTKAVRDACYDPVWLHRSMKAILSIAKACGEHFSGHLPKQVDSFLAFIQPPSPKSTDIKLLLSEQTALLKLCCSGGGQESSCRLSLGALQRLLTSNLLTLRSSPDTGIVSALMDLFRCIANAALQQSDVFDFLVRALAEECTTLVAGAATATSLSSITFTTTRIDTRLVHSSAKLLMFNLSVLQSAPSLKCSEETAESVVLPLLRAVLSPATCPLITLHLPLQLLSTKLLLKFATSDALTRDEALLKASLLDALQPAQPAPVKLEVLQWMTTLQQHNGIIISDDCVRAVIQCSIDKEDNVRAAAGKALTALCRVDRLPASEAAIASHACFYRLSDINPAVRRVFVNLLGAIGPSTKALSAAERSLPAWLHPTGAWKHTMSSHIAGDASYINRADFQRMMELIAPGIGSNAAPVVVLSASELSERASRLIIASDRLAEILQPVPHSSAHGNNVNITENGLARQLASQLSLIPTAVEYILFLQCARYIVNNKLRTPYGAPAQTLEAIEKAFHRLVATTVGLNNANVHLATNADHLFASIKRFLSFLDVLEKQIYIASEGSLHVDAAAAEVTASAASFFRTNKKVCADWFARIRPKLMSAAVNHHGPSAPHDAIRHGSERLWYLAKFVGSTKLDTALLKRECEQALLTVALGFLQTKQEDAIEGLNKWAKSVFGRRRQPDGTTGPAVADTHWLKSLMSITTGRYEIAAMELREAIKQLSPEEITQYGETGVMDTMTTELARCYVKLSDWDAAQQWLSESASFSPAQSASNKQRFSSYVQSVINYERGQYGAVLNVVQPKTTADAGGAAVAANHISGAYSSDLAMIECLAAIRANKSPATGPTSVAQRLERVRHLLEPSLSLHSSEAPPPIDDVANIIKINALQVIEEHLRPQQSAARASSLVGVSNVVTSWLDSDVEAAHELGIWGDWTRVFRSTGATPPTDILVRLVSLARKQRNIKVAGALLGQLEQLKPLSSVHIELERAKLQYAQGNKTDAINKLSQLVPAAYDAAQATPQHGSMLLTLSKWLSREKVNYHHNHSIDTTVGDHLKQATQLLPNWSSALYKYADWCYNRSRRLLKLASQCDSEESLESLLREVRLSDHIQSLSDCANGDSAALAQLANRVFSRSGDGASEDQDRGTTTSILDEITSHVAEILPRSASSSVVDNVVSIWKKVREALLDGWSISADAYFKFLLTGTSSSSSSTTPQPSLPSSLPSLDGGAAEPTITATLRLLKLIVRHGADMKDLFAEQLAKTPTAPWRDITPQLFARLSQPEKSVRQLVMQLLDRISQDYPHVVVFPAVVGARVDDADELTPQQRQYGAIKSTLVHRNPSLVSDVEMLLTELGRITLLWEEQALTSLREIQADVSGRIRTLRGEYARIGDQFSNTDNNSNTAVEKRRLLADVYATVMKPAIVKLERLFKDILREPQTKHEHWFQATYKRALEEALYQFRNPANPEDAESAFAAFREIYKELTRYLKRLSLKLEIITPKLASLSSSGIPVPGLQNTAASLSRSNESITIQSVLGQVMVLPTKTKPKKLVLVGSDGVRYPFLLKGHEDLHLDERIMQFLSIVNRFLQRNTRTRRRGLSARNYAVIPTGASSGLIQWVENSVPVYSVFSDWQRRSSANTTADVQPTAIGTGQQQQQQQQQQAHAQGQPTASTTAGKQKLLRPIDQFYAKLIPALKAAGVRNVMNRSEWPEPTLRRVFMELERESPRDLLDRELWCASTSTADWWNRSTTYNRSVAVMSIIGYVLGLGDRHLDNILLDFKTGEIIHIDYNVCFEKGLKLRVPEVVPFRLTQNMHRALGVTGVEGTFRISCEETLSVMRQERETLLTLLEAFVYDPLVDWTSDKALMEEKSMELDVICTLFTARADELASRVSMTYDTTAAALPEFLEACVSVINNLDAYTAAHSHLEQLSVSRASMEERSAKLTVELKAVQETITQAALKERSSLEVSAGLQASLQTAYQEFVAWQQAADSTYNGLKMIGPAHVLAVRGLPPTLKSDAIPRTLGQYSTLQLLQLDDRMVQSCHEKDAEMVRTLQHREAAVQQLVDLLVTYRARILPLLTSSMYSNSNCGYVWMQILRVLLQQNPAMWNKEQVLELSSLVNDSADPAKFQARVTSAHLELANLQQEVQNTERKLLQLRETLAAGEARSQQLEVTTQRAAQQLEQVTNSLNASTVITILGELPEGATYVHYCAALCVVQLLNSIPPYTELSFPDNTSASASTLDTLLLTVDEVIALTELLKGSWMTVDMDVASSLPSPTAIVNTKELVTIALQLGTSFTTETESLVAIAKRDLSTIARARDNLASIVTLWTDAAANKGSQRDGLEAEDEVLGEDTWDAPCQPPASLANMANGARFFDLSQEPRSLFADVLVEATMTGQDDVGMQLIAVMERKISALEQEYRRLQENLEMTRHIDPPSVVEEQNLFGIKKAQLMLDIFIDIETQSEDHNMIRRMIQHHISQFAKSITSHLLLPLLRAASGSYIASLVHDTETEESDGDGHAAALSEDRVQSLLHRACPDAAHQSLILTLIRAYLDARKAYSSNAARLDQIAHRVSTLEWHKQRHDADKQMFEWLNDAALTDGAKPVASPAAAASARLALLDQLSRATQAVEASEAAVLRSEQQYQLFEVQIQKAIQFFHKQHKDPSGVLRFLMEAIGLRRQAMQLASDRTRQVFELAKGVVTFEAMRTMQPHQHPIASTASKFVAAMSEAVSARVDLAAAVPRTQDLQQQQVSIQRELATIAQELPKSAEREKVSSGGVINKLKIMEAAARSISEAADIDDALWPDLEPLLTSIVKLTDGWEDVQHIHSLGKKLLAYQRRYRTTFQPVASTARGLLAAYSAPQSDAATATASLRQWVVASRPTIPAGGEPLAEALLDLQDKVQVLLEELAKHATDRVQGDDVEGQEESDDEDESTASATAIDSISTTAGTAQPVPAAALASSGSIALAKNTTAIGVLKRVRQKLEGSDLPPIHTASATTSAPKLSIPSQVDWVIREATSVDNLSKLYEGWTAWI